MRALRNTHATKIGRTRVLTGVGRCADGLPVPSNRRDVFLFLPKLSGSGSRFEPATRTGAALFLSFACRAVAPTIDAADPFRAVPTSIVSLRPTLGTMNQ